MDPTHFYVDLAALQNTTQLPETNCHYNKLINAVMCVSNKAVPTSVAQSYRKHIKPAATSNIPVRYQLLDQPLNNIDNTYKNPKRTIKNTDSEFPTYKTNVKKFPQVVIGHTSSPHHLRHRNRQEDQARAMAQVVRWLEQEFSSNVQAGDKREKAKTPSWSSNNQEKHNSSTNTNLENGVERHEHHHVHEHVHHHYHHYQETPVVV